MISFTEEEMVLLGDMVDLYIYAGMVDEESGLVVDSIQVKLTNNNTTTKTPPPSHNHKRRHY